MAYFTQLDFKEAFSLFDKNGDGRISSSEIQGVMKKLGYNPNATQIQNMMRSIDLDGNGFVDFQEFKAMLLGKSIAATTEEELKEIFKAVDKNGDGFIGAKELKAMFKIVGQKVSRKEIKNMIRIADEDGDGKVSYEEFKRLMKANDYEERLNIDRENVLHQENS